MFLTVTDWLIPVFIIGAAIGSFLNVCIARLPLEKSLLWPNGSCCGQCYQPIRWYDNIPLLSYCFLRGRCRHCGASFSFQYFLVELLTALGFAGIYYLVAVENVHQLAALRRPNPAGAWLGVPTEVWVAFAHHATLFSFLMVIAFCDLNQREIPLTVTVTGTLAGLVFSTAWPWPWPAAAVPAFLAIPAGAGWFQPAFFRPPPEGLLQPLPFFWPLPFGMEGGTWASGLLNGVAGMLAGSFLLRGIRFLFGIGRGMEGLGLGDADLMMMAGAFLGWQPMAVAFFISVVPALLLGVIKVIITRDQALPFGPALALSVMATCLFWHAWGIGPQLQPLLANSQMLLLLVVVGGLFLVLAALVLRVLRGTPKSDP